MAHYNHNRIYDDNVEFWCFCLMNKFVDIVLTYIFVINFFAFWHKNQWVKVYPFLKKIFWYES